MLVAVAVLVLLLLLVLVVPIRNASQKRLLCRYGIYAHHAARKVRTPYLHCSSTVFALCFPRHLHCVSTAFALRFPRPLFCVFRGLCLVLSTACDKGPDHLGLLLLSTARRRGWLRPTSPSKTIGRSAAALGEMNPPPAHCVYMLPLWCHRRRTERDESTPACSAWHAISLVLPPPPPPPPH